MDDRARARCRRSVALVAALLVHVALLWLIQPSAINLMAPVGSDNQVLVELKQMSPFPTPPEILFGPTTQYLSVTQLWFFHERCPAGNRPYLPSAFTIAKWSDPFPLIHPTHAT
jgi:hypothetical protein